MAHSLHQLAGATLVAACALLVPQVALAGGNGNGHGHGHGNGHGHGHGNGNGHGHHGGHGPIEVDAVSFPVTLGDGNTYAIAGYLYHRGNIDKQIVQVTVHGATYDHRYWDVPPLDGVDYSYARYMVEQGFAVLAIDQLGTGASDQPPGDFLNLQQTALGLHQVVDSLHRKNNPIQKKAFDRVALVGHSNGSVTSIASESAFHDADALVVTGWGHTAQQLPIDPSQLAPFFATPYVVLPPPVSLGLRLSLFYHVPAADPDMITYDANTLTAPISRGQFSDLLFALTPNPTLDGVAGVTGPVLVQLGEFDVIAPASAAAAEPSFYESASSVTVQTLPDIGHVFNTHLNHEQSWEGIAYWLKDTLGRHGDDDCNDD